jgi:hypothetical protein
VKRHAESGRDPLASRLMAATHEEADRCRHGFVGCEHLLLALLTDKDPTAKDILAAQGISLPAARAAVDVMVAGGRGDGPRWNPTDLLATLGVDVAAIQRRMQADFGTHAIAELYRSPVGRHLSWGPLCGLQVAPSLKKALFQDQGHACFATTGHALLSLLDAGSPGLAAVLDALGTSTDRLRVATADRIRDAG